MISNVHLCEGRAYEESLKLYKSILLKVIPLADRYEHPVLVFILGNFKLMCLLQQCLWFQVNNRIFILMKMEDFKDSN